jgi:hypothetical protein
MPIVIQRGGKQVTLNDALADVLKIAKKIKIKNKIVLEN